LSYAKACCDPFITINNGFVTDDVLTSKDRESTSNNDVNDLAIDFHLSDIYQRYAQSCYALRDFNANIDSTKMAENRSMVTNEFALREEVYCLSKTRSRKVVYEESLATLSDFDAKLLLESNSSIRQNVLHNRQNDLREVVPSVIKRRPLTADVVGTEAIFKNSSFIWNKFRFMHYSTKRKSRGDLSFLTLIPREKISVIVAGDIGGRENKENLLNDGQEAWNKWVHPGRVATSWILYDFGDTEFEVASYGLCSANDCPHRDPIAWTLEGFDARNKSWIELHTCPRNNDVFECRFEWHWYTLKNVNRCTKVRLNITEVRRARDCIQLAHFHVKAMQKANSLAASASADKTLPLSSLSDVISIQVAGDICGGGTGKEVKENLLKDGQEAWNKWVHPGSVHSSWIIYDFGNTTLNIFAYGLCSANDCPRRDPIQWTLEGYDSTLNQWTKLHHVPEDRNLFQSRFEWHWYTLDDAKSCSKVRLLIEKVRHAGDCLQLAHFHIKTKSGDY
jgi:hypothetical protein